MRVRSFLFLTCATVISQWPAPLAAAAPEQAKAARGIEKKDIRYLIVHEEDGLPVDRLRAVENSVRELADAVARGNAGFPGEIGQRLSRLRSAPVVIGVTVPDGANLRPIQCPPQNCGCTGKNLAQSCSCGLYKEYCYCLLCYEPIKLTPYPEEDPVLTTIHIKGRMASPGRGTPGSQATEFAGGLKGRVPGHVVVVVTTPATSAEKRRSLAEFGVKTLQAEPFPAGITIKRKSCCHASQK